MIRIKIFQTYSNRKFQLALLLISSAIITGLLVAFFLELLDYVTFLRLAQPWLIYFLPVGGILILLLYKLAPKDIARGNDLIIETINLGSGKVPGQITPVILVSTLVTHIFGGSAGREGTAVQMGGGVAGYLSSRFSMNSDEQRLLLNSGMAAGFGAVFGTPLAGAVFAIEVLKVGRIKYEAFVYCLISSVIGDLSCRLTGVQHTLYTVHFVPAVDSQLNWVSGNISLLFKVILAGCIFGCAARLFVWMSEVVKKMAMHFLPRQMLRPVIGACLVIGISLVIGNFDYLGLGVTNPLPDSVSIISSFKAGGADYDSWFWKMLLTVVTLAFGFKGGEVTPLFFVGATLGNVIAMLTGAPVDLFAAIGFVAVFAGATNTPIACTLMGMELFGPVNILFFGTGCLAAYMCSGTTGIYRSQQSYDTDQELRLE